MSQWHFIDLSGDNTETRDRQSSVSMRYTILIAELLQVQKYTLPLWTYVLVTGKYLKICKARQKYLFYFKSTDTCFISVTVK